MVTFIIFIIIIAVLVLSHEFGHYFFAKVRGVRVDEFGFGFPPRLIGKKFGETTYSINWLPFGGFVKIYGEDQIEESKDPRNFASRSTSDRFWIIFAGVLMNMLLAYLLFTFGHIWGLPTVVDDSNLTNTRNLKIQIFEIVKNSPAEQAGIQAGDAITGYGEEAATIEPTDIQSVQDFIIAHKGKQIVIKTSRGSEDHTYTVTPRENPPGNEGALGIAMVRTGIVATPWYKAPWEGLKTTMDVTKATAEGLAMLFGQLFQGKVSSDVAGPVGIAKIAGEASKLGFVYLLQLTALLSINLAILNILPLPALDGGRILFLIIEKIKGSPVNTHTSQTVHMIGFIVLISLMLFITYRDIVKLF